MLKRWVCITMASEYYYYCDYEIGVDLSFRVLWSPAPFNADEVYTLARSADNSWGPCRHYSLRAVIEEQLGGHSIRIISCSRR